MNGVRWVLLASLCGCGWVDFGGGHDTDADGDADADTDADADADPCAQVTCDVAPEPTCLDDERLQRHRAPGLCRDGQCEFSAEEVDCGDLGCCTDHCCAVDPSNGAALGELQPMGHDVEVIDGAFDTSTDCDADSPLGACEVAAQADGPEVCVCRMDDLSIGDLVVTGSRALALFVAERATIDGTIDARGRGTTAGPGATFEYAENGAAGGSYGTVGGNESAEVWGNAEIAPLRGGMDGQDFCDFALGGGGGGAVQITAGEAITVWGTIGAGGGGGQGGSGACAQGAPGGGSGGAILLEAPEVTVRGALIAAGGGGGGSNGTDGAGGAGGDSTLESNFGTFGGYGGSGNDGYGCPLYGYSYGGAGGFGASAGEGGDGESGNSEWRCLSGNGSVGRGGGGGGAGRVRINTLAGCDCAGEIAPAATTGDLAVR